MVEGFRGFGFEVCRSGFRLQGAEFKASGLTPKTLEEV